MSLTVALNSALSGLNINQRSLQVLSQNITNANTPGYSREVVHQAAIYLNGTGAGVSLDSITRKADDLLQLTVRDKSSDVGMSDTIYGYMQQAQILYGQPGSTGSIDQTVQSFFSTLQGLSVSPESGSAQQSAVLSGVTLAQQLTTLSNGLQNIRMQADQQIGASINTVNQAISDLYKLNAVLTRAHASGQETTGLMDQRDRDLMAVARQLDINITMDEAGAVQVFAGGGVPLVDSSMHRLEYTPAPSVNSFINGIALTPLNAIKLDAQGNPTGTPVALVPAGVSETLVSGVTSGTIGALLQVRDTLMPAAIAQLDNFASNLRDQVNRLQNSGSGFPGVSSLTGSRLVTGSDSHIWSGSMRIAALDASGQPLTSPYPDEGTTGIRALSLDLGALNGGTGTPTVQSIINALNGEFGAPQNKAELGNLNNISLVSKSTQLPGSSQSLTFDFSLDNISGGDSRFWVTGTSVVDDTGTPITSVTSTLPSFALNPFNTYTTTSGSADVTVKTLNPPTGLSNGDMVYLGNPGATVNGILASDLTGFFTVSNVTAAGFTIHANGIGATSSGPQGAAGVTGMPAYATTAAGEKARSSAGDLTASFAGNPFSSYYDITAQVTVADEAGTIRSGNVTYRIYNQANGMLNRSYAATAVGGGATLVNAVGNLTPALVATLVDADGREIAKDPSGTYIDVPGYLKLTARNGATVAIDQLDSAESTTGYGFSQFFALNDFFKTGSAGSVVARSATTLEVSDTLRRNPAGISTGTLARSNQPSAPGATPLYTYHRVAGDNSIAQQFAALGTLPVSFGGAGGLSNQTTSLTDYAGLIIGSAAASAQNAKDSSQNNQALLDGFQSRLDTLTGVNIDEELANTVLYQNSYSATARIITVVDKMMQDLINVFQ